MIGVATIIVGEDVFGIEPDRLGAVGDRAVVIALVTMGVTPVVVGAGILGSSRIASV